MHSWSVSKNSWLYNIILQAEVDYHSEIGSGAWNIPSCDCPDSNSFHGGRLWVPISGTGGSLGAADVFIACFTDILVSLLQRRTDLPRRK